MTTHKLTFGPFTAPATIEVPIDRDDLASYFRATWDQAYPSFLEQAQDAWENTGSQKYDYQQGNFVLPAAIEYYEATGDQEVRQQAMELIDAAIANAKPTIGVKFPEGYLGWTHNEHVSALSELQWAVGAVLVAESQAVGRREQSNSAWSEHTLAWIDKHMLEKWWDASTAKQRHFINSLVQGAVVHPRQSWFADKVFINIGLGFALRSGLRVFGQESVAFTGGERWGTPDDWWNAFWRTRYTVTEGASLVFDFDNAAVANHTGEGENPYYNHDTIHANRHAQTIAYDYLRRGLVAMPQYKFLALCKTVTDRIWNGRRDDACLINNYITGETGYSYHGAEHQQSGMEGYGWIYNGWGKLGVYDPAVQEICQHVLDLVRRGKNVSATYARHNTVFGKLGLAASILWSDYWRTRLEW